MLLYVTDPACISHASGPCVAHTFASEQHLTSHTFRVWLVEDLWRAAWRETRFGGEAPGHECTRPSALSPRHLATPPPPPPPPRPSHPSTTAPPHTSTTTTATTNPTAPCHERTRVHSTVPSPLSILLLQSIYCCCTPRYPPPLLPAFVGCDAQSDSSCCAGCRTIWCCSTSSSRSSATSCAAALFGRTSQHVSLSDTYGTIERYIRNNWAIHTKQGDG